MYKQRSIAYGIHKRRNVVSKLLTVYGHTSVCLLALLLSAGCHKTLCVSTGDLPFSLLYGVLPAQPSNDVAILVALVLGPLTATSTKGAQGTVQAIGQ